MYAHPARTRRPTAVSCPAGAGESQQALQRVRAKQAVVAQLIAGQLRLVEAARRFRTAGQLLAAAPDGEGVCRTLIGWAYLALNDRPELAEAVSDRLERELDSHLKRHGRVVLAG